MGFAGSGARHLVLCQVVSFAVGFEHSHRSCLAMDFAGNGIVILFIANRFRTSVLMLVLLMIISYLYVGVTGNFLADQIVSVVSTVFGEDRAVFKV